MALRILTVSYGHGSASGKTYDYETDKAYRAGDVVVVPVEHHKSGKLYNTLATVQRTTSEDSSAGERLLDHLTDPKNDIKPKSVAMRLEIARAAGHDVKTQRQVNITTLPGYSTKLSSEKWSRAADTSSTRLISRGQ